MGPDLDLWARRSDGTELPVQISLSPVTFGHGPRVIAIVRDVTAHRAGERVARELLLRADQERIGDELRRGVISDIFAAGMAIQAVVGQTEPEMARRLLEIADDLDVVINEIRNSVLPLTTPPEHPAH